MNYEFIKTKGKGKIMITNYIRKIGNYNIDIRKIDSLSSYLKWRISLKEIRSGRVTHFGEIIFHIENMINEYEVIFKQFNANATDDYYKQLREDANKEYSKLLEDWEEFRNYLDYSYKEIINS